MACLAAMQLLSCAASAQIPPVEDVTKEITPPVVEAVAVESTPSATMVRDERLDRLIQNVVEAAAEESRKHMASRVSATVVDLGYVDDPLAQPTYGSWRGDTRVYPASVVKIFFMGAAYVWQRQGKLTITPSVYSDLKYMIGPSSNVATQRILNKICGVESGSALSASEYQTFARKREAVNTWLKTLGLERTNANQATWDSTYSPRDKQLVTGNLTGKGPHVNQNLSTANDIARFLLLIERNGIGTKEDCDAMRGLMERDARDRRRNGYRRIFQDALPEGTTVWGKSGFTSDTSHDAAIITTTDGRRFILVVLAEVTWDNTSFLGDCAAETVKALREVKPREGEAMRVAGQ